MKQVNYIMKVKDDYIPTGWDEEISEYVEDNVVADEHAQSIIDNWNRTLKPHEKQRTLVSVKIIESDKKAILKHDWGKVSLVTEKGGFDKMKCKRCGCTGKRYGLNSYIKLDKKFDKPKYQDGCPIDL